MCAVCNTLMDKVNKARSEQNPEKERVMRVIFHNHMELEHKARRMTTAIVEADYIIWPNGIRWEVVR